MKIFDDFFCVEQLGKCMVGPWKPNIPHLLRSTELEQVLDTYWDLEIIHNPSKKAHPDFDCPHIMGVSIFTPMSKLMSSKHAA